jgi:hypothetical protein
METTSFTLWLAMCSQHCWLACASQHVAEHCVPVLQLSVATAVDCLVLCMHSSYCTLLLCYRCYCCCCRCCCHSPTAKHTTNREAHLSANLLAAYNLSVCVLTSRLLNEMPLPYCIYIISQLSTAHCNAVSETQ